MSRNQTTMWNDQRLTLADSISLTQQSLLAYATDYRHWAIAYSGGKDSSATVTAVMYLLEHDLIPRPESLTVLYSDTRQEIPPLHFSAMTMLAVLRARGVHTQVVLPVIDDRYFVYMLGRVYTVPALACWKGAERLREQLEAL